MDCSGSGLGERGVRQTTFQSPSGEDERQQQQERLNREEAYYQFINELSDKDYRLMRDCNLLGTPGEITADELQLRLQGVKEHLVSQSETENREDSEALGLNSASDSLPEWLRMLRRTENSTSSEQRGSQTWRVANQVNPASRGFHLRLEINVHDGYSVRDGPSEEFEDISHGHTIRSHAENTPPIADGPIASRTRSRVLRETFGHASAASGSGSRSGSVPQNGEETRGLFSGRHSSRNSGSAIHNTFLDDNEHSIIRQRRVERFTPMRPRSGRAEVRTWRRTRQRSEALRSQSQTLLEGWQRRDTQQAQRRSRRAHTVHSPPQQGETEVPSLDMLRLEEASGTSTIILVRHPAITLELQVRRIHSEAYRDQQRIDVRTHSRAGVAENLFAFEGNNEGYRWTFSQPEYAGMQTYVTISPHQISEAGLGESSSVGLRSIIRQVRTEVEDLRPLIDTESYHAIQRSVQHLSEMQSELSNLQNGEFRGTSLGSSPAEQGSREWDGGANAVQHGSRGDETQDRRQFQDANSLVGNERLPILRLVPYLLFDDYTNDGLRGLTKDQMDSLSTRNYGTIPSEEGEINKTCSVCMNDYVVGNKLRQLPCMHEFHFHCIDRWLSENFTCPICRQSVVT